MMFHRIFKTHGAKVPGWASMCMQPTVSRAATTPQNRPATSMGFSQMNFVSKAEEEYAVILCELFNIA